MYKHFFKRFLDFFISLIALICLSPVLLVVTIWLHFVNKGAGAFFFQERPGKDERIFKIWKFKTMTDERDENGELLTDAQRVTRAGTFVRNSSLDELPQLVNVLKGDMALIGPRPLLVRYLPYYRENERMRHSVRPGITGWAQVCGRTTVTWDDKLAHDVEYVKNLSFSLDMKIIWLTIKNVLKGSDTDLQDESQDLDVIRKNEIQS